jgi:hypothetical protein
MANTAPIAMLSLGIDQIRFYGDSSYQVMRRPRALLADLEQVLPVERHAAIQQQMQRFEAATNRAFDNPSDLREARQMTGRASGCRDRTYRPQP